MTNYLIYDLDFETILLEIYDLEAIKMDEDAFMDWFQHNFDNNAIKYAESREEDFEEFCFNKFQQIGVDDCDDAYDRWKDEQIEKKEN